uniref:Prophenoloxidase n=1 Tax=Panulirus longipes TaxID=59761 RepID=G8Z1X6_PANLO|nr:prophenoloxidase [Panulirus longipes]
MASDQSKVLSILEKPYEKPKGDVATGIEFPSDLAVTDRIAGRQPTSGAGVEIGKATFVRRGTAFSLFIESHRLAAKDLIDAFMRTDGLQALVELAARVKVLVNESLFVYAFSYVILHKKDLQNVRLPSLIEMFPNKFVPQEDIMKAQVEANRRDPDDTTPIIIEYGPEFSSTNIKPEHRVSYWREDYGINSHHWHWHLAYPAGFGDPPDRKGELFFYMHQQMLARYDMERLSVGLTRTEKLENWRIPVPDGYFSKLTVNNTSRAWGTRQDNSMLMDFKRQDLGLDPIDITDIEIWRSRLLDAIHQGYMIDRNGDKVPLSDDVTSGKRGIDILGDAFEADRRLSVNSLYYGDLHNLGHVVIAFTHDSDNAHKEDMGVMGDSSTAMRDPIFYRWHKFVDDVFQEYKLTQQPYSLEDLSLPNVVLDRVGVLSKDQADALSTGWTVREFEAFRGLDFNSRAPVNLRITHIDHAPFDYHLQVTNRLEAPKQVTVRIFLAPKFNVRGLEMSFMEQRLLWAEMDKFTVTLKPGTNHVVQSSSDSSITTSEEYTFRDLETGPQPGTSRREFNFCGCGWPQHVLLPRGTPGGMVFQLFVMVTDFEKDKVDQQGNTGRCANGVSFCGILDAKYPDSRPMGFPFDRRNPPQFQSAADFAEQLDNVNLHDITITFQASSLTK